MDKKTLTTVGIIASGLAGIILISCCALIILRILPEFFPKKPDHYGVFIQESSSFEEMKVYPGGPKLDDNLGIPVTSNTNPTILIWTQVNLNYLVIQDKTRGGTLEYNVTPKDEEMLEMRALYPFNSGLYCLYQGDPLGLPYQIKHWCFRVEVPDPTPSAILFLDDFSQGLKIDWQIHDGKWEVKENKLIGKEFTVDSEATISVGNSDWHNYTVDLDTGTFNLGKSAAAIYVRMQDNPQNAMWFQISDSIAACGINKGGKDITLSPIFRIIKGDHHLSLKVQDNKYEYLVDGTYICSFHDDTFSKGKVGIWAYSVEPPKTNSETPSFEFMGASSWDREIPWFDNFKISQLPD